MSYKENTKLGAVKIPVARVSKRSIKAKVLAGSLSSTQVVYLYPPKIKGNDWGLAIGTKGEKPRIMTNLKEIADGILESDGETKWHAIRISLPTSAKCAWDISFSASKA